MKTLLLVAIAAAVGWVVWQSRDDVARYQRLRDM